MNADYFMNLLSVFISAALINNVILSQFLVYAPSLVFRIKLKRLPAWV